MTKKQALIILGIICIASAALGLLSLTNIDAGWAVIGVGFAITYIVGGLVILVGIVKLVLMLTSSKVSPEQKKWTQKRLLFIAVAAIIIFFISYLRTPH